MALRSDAMASIDIVETLFALMVVSIGVIMLSASLPALIRDTAEGPSLAEEMVTALISDGALDLAQAERRAANLTGGIGIRIISEQGPNLTLRELIAPEHSDLHVIRVPVLLRTASGEMAAILEVSCAD
jgi:hypothetical protein